MPYNEGSRLISLLLLSMCIILWHRNTPVMSRFLFLSAVVFTSVVCQSLVPTTGSATFPECAVGCPLLQEAQANCVPPAAPVTDQATYRSCFCQSSLLQALHSSPNGVCDAVCPPAELNTLQQWYAGLCATGNPEVTQTTTTLATSTTTSSNAGPDPGTETSSKVHYEAPPSWFSTHWRWVVMIIVLAIGFTALTLLLVYLKRRHKRKRAYQAPFTPAQSAVADGDGGRSNYSGRQPTSRNLVAAALGDDTWGPQQHLAHPPTKGLENDVSSAGTHRGTEPGQFTRAHPRSRNMRGQSPSKEQL
ncbi:uncharacterized protein BDCG_01934 [Blastomyces dermatitidis ER-3]|uniref:Integral membrane protein n=1 Tax=Ajellomyces dermatitidis (strain ER-3 / ATCC MYA-2586) TaxID=559297 RepID=A0ABP2EXH0_AJEDR|nr:uncharacterized protein BDCG_01934 [Blastomyces dermatitidis ER-3]EEQ86814.2 integral membrane protein [Blastomyces dermatitidis ER-3]